MKRSIGSLILSEEVTVLLLMACIGSSQQQPLLRNQAVTISSVNGSCPTAEMREATRDDGQWRRIAHLNMSDPGQQCPPNWRLTEAAIRGCSWSSLNSSACDSAFFPSNGVSYSQVCGRVIAYQYGSPDAFDIARLSNPGIEDPYIDSMKVILTFKHDSYVLAQTPTSFGHTKVIFLPLLETTTFATLLILDLVLISLQYMQTILFGMVRGVALLTHVAT